MRRRLLKMLSAVVPLLALMAMASTSASAGTGVVTVAANGGSCIAFTAAQAGGPDNWEVAEGGSYTMTISGVTECSGDAITVFMQASDSADGNWCFNASKTGTGVYVGTFTVPLGSCHTMPISYKCGADQPCNNSNTFDANGPSNTGKVHLRAATFGAGCQLTGVDENCSKCVPLVKPTINCGEDDSRDLGCNPTELPKCGDKTATDDCGPVPVKCESKTESNGCLRTLTITYTATNSVGTDTCVRVYTYKLDSEAPKAEAPDDVDVQCPGDVPPKTDLTATDNCDPDITVSPVDSDPVKDAEGCGYTITRTWTFEDACHNSSSVSQKIHVKDTTAPELPEGPKDFEGQCDSDVPPKVDLTAKDNCDGDIKVSPTDSEPVKDDEGCGYTITRTWTFTDGCGNTSKLYQKIHIKDTEAPKLSCPDDKKYNPPCDTIEFAVEFEATATDNCDASPKIVYTLPNGTVIESGYKFPCGVTTVTATATDACGNSDSCDFEVNINCVPCKELRLFKFKDVDANGAFDPTIDTPLCGINITVCYDDPRTVEVESICTTVTTDANGIAIVDVPEGATYTVCETLPETGDANCRWVQTFPTATTPGTTTIDGKVCYTGTIAVDTELAFGNICACTPSTGFTLGFWSNQNGRAILLANDPAWRTALNALNLRKANGTAYDVPLTAFGTSQTTGAYGNFRTWLLQATATNMAYMLSAQLAASTLNGLYKGESDATILVLTPELAQCYGSLFATLGTVRAQANAALAANGYTVAAGADRSWQECLKKILDAANNNLLVTISGACADPVCPPAP